MNIIERISNEAYEQTGHMPEDFQLIREKAGVHVYRCIYQGKKAIAKYFEKAADRREIFNYQWLQKWKIPTPTVYALGKTCILMEDIEASEKWRLGAEADLSDAGVARVLAAWYVCLHEPGIAWRLDYSENDLFSRESLAFLQEKLPEADRLWAYLLDHFDMLRKIIDRQDSFITYNDFYWTNLMVKKDGSAALMFDYNLMGKGYRYADIRNVKSSLSEEAGRCFEAEYCKMYREKYGGEPDFSEEKQLDDVVSPVLGLISAYGRTEFPAWAEEGRQEAVDGTLLERARALLNEQYKKELTEQLRGYIPFNEQEECDREIILNWLESGQEIFTRENKTAHMTASAWVVSPDRKKVLMAYHNLYNSWAWLGGHADGETDLMAVARREAMEESGIRNIRPLCDSVFSLEVLTVDGHEKKEKYVSSHLHLNVTYLFEADMADELTVKADENSAVGWVGVDEMPEKVSEPWFLQRIYSKLSQKAAALSSMKQVILSANGPKTVYAVPAEVAENLRKYCIEFADHWLRNSQDAEKYRVNGVFCFDERDFIEYLNKYLFPAEKSFVVCPLGWIENKNDIPEKYRDLPRFNF